MPSNLWLQPDVVAGLCFAKRIKIDYDADLQQSEICETGSKPFAVISLVWPILGVERKMVRILIIWVFGACWVSLSLF